MITSPKVTGAAPIAFLADLGRHGDAPALLDERGSLSYIELARAIEARRERLGRTRRLVAIDAHWTRATVVTYLAALAAGHPVLLTGAGPAGRAMLARYRPDLWVTGPDAEITEPNPAEPNPAGTGEAPERFHPDLALLLSTSGSTGDPKLVRLSGENLGANAAAIAESLGLTADDRGITSLPMQYCYGLSVLHSHLHVGAAVVLCRASVVDPCFRRALHDHGVTGLAGVPHTFDMLERSGFNDLSLPCLRYLTQAGGRMAPERVRRVATAAAGQGRRLFVMYGQTEATARMACLPPSLVLDHPDSVGLPIAGGRFRLAPTDHHPDPTVGELVYAGPNVMLGYAQGPEDLALGRTVDELHTGDLARITEDGLVEIVGRSRRMIKPLGLRIDLARVETLLAEDGIDAVCAGDDHLLVAAVDPAHREHALTVLGRIGLPAGAVATVDSDTVPRRANGKPDEPALLHLARSTAGATCRDRSTRDPDAGGDVLQLFAEVLRRPGAQGSDTFVDLGGDSLSYVEMTIRLEALLGTLPPDWHLRTIASLEPARRADDHGHAEVGTTSGRWRVHRMEATVVVRAVAVVLITGSHVGAFGLMGGAHTMLVLTGMGFARFLVGDDPEGATHRILGCLRRIVIPSVLVLSVVAWTNDRYGLPSVLLLNHQLGTTAWSEPWNYWYIEAVAAILAVAALAFTRPGVRALDRRYPFALPMGVVAAALLFRFRIIDLGPRTIEVLRPHMVLWLFAIGWAAHRATSRRERLLVSLVVLAALPGYFPEGQGGRTITVVCGVLVVVWLHRLPVPHPGHRVVGALASASLWTYLIHFHLFPPLLAAGVSPALTTVACLASGVAAHQLWERSARNWAGVRPVSRAKARVNAAWS